MTPGSGELIYQERRRRGWSKPRLCDEIQAWEYQHGNGDVLGLNPNYVREWESGERSVSDFYAPKLSAVLGIPLGTFVDRRTRRGRAAGPSEGGQGGPASAMAAHVAGATAEASLVPLGVRERLLQQWADLAMLGPLGQRLLAKILEPRRTLIMDRRTIIKLLGTASTAALLELLRDSGVVASAEAQPPLVLDPTSTYVVDSLALRYQHMYHSTAPAELMIPVTAHLELVDELASTAPTGPQRQQVLRNHSQVALLAGRLSFFDLHDPGTARAYYGMSLDSAREAGDPHLEAVTLGHMSFVAAATRSFRAAIDLLEGANEHASGSTIVPSWLAAVESEIRSKAGETSAALAAVERAEAALVPAKEIPTWMDYYDATRLNGFKGFAYLAAGQVDQAETALQTAIACLDAGAVKQRSVLLTDLATAYVHEGEVDKGCELASEAAVTLTRAGYETSAERLREFRQLVRPWQDRGSVKDLDERLGLV
jgi:transcriptional regulator with XRE-family HTH domain/tetratricopeptide (TPR) repeat protein